MKIESARFGSYSRREVLRNICYFPSFAILCRLTRRGTILGLGHVLGFRLGTRMHWKDSFPSCTSLHTTSLLPFVRNSINRTIGLVASAIACHQFAYANLHKLMSQVQPRNAEQSQKQVYLCMCKLVEGRLCVLILMNLKRGKPETLNGRSVDNGLALRVSAHSINIPTLGKLAIIRRCIYA